MIITYDSEAKTVTVDDLEPIPIESAEEAMMIFKTAISEGSGDTGNEMEMEENAMESGYAGPGGK